MEFIDLVCEDRHTCALAFDCSSSKPGHLTVVGELPHHLQFQPRTKTDADNLINWLIDNMEEFPDEY